MDEDCCYEFGGRISIEVDGTFYRARGDISLMPSNVEVAAEAHQDGTMFSTSKPRLYGAEMSFSQPCGLVWDEALRKCRVNVTIVEESNNRTHLFTKARIVGNPKLNLSTGEVSGVSIAAAIYSFRKG
jgi:hypothetical protein